VSAYDPDDAMLRTRARIALGELEAVLYGARVDHVQIIEDVVGQDLLDEDGRLIHGDESERVAGAALALRWVLRSEVGV